MEKLIDKALYDIFPRIIYTVDRNATSSWELNGMMKNHNLMLVYDGEAIFTSNGASECASRGTLIYWKPGDLRTAHTFQHKLMKAYAIDFTYICPVFIEENWNLETPILPFDFSQKIVDENLLQKLIELFNKLTKSVLSTRGRNKVRERTIFIEILSLLFQNKEGNLYSYSNMRRVEKIVNYMTENYSKSITLEELAVNAHISPSYLGSIFKMVTGKSTIDYLIEIRMNKAKVLLKDGYSVSETSKIVGFSDIFYFSKTFKKHEGVSPSTYLNIDYIEI